VNERNIRLLIAFDGTGYKGWQRQHDAPTIQGELEDRLRIMTGTPVVLHGAGRTDAGVHATGMTANFHTEATIPCAGLVAGLNSMLPPDIRILEAEEMEPSFHSRFSATGKTYCYTFFTGRVQLPLRRLYCAHLPCRLDPQKIIAAVAHLRGRHDFSSFEGKSRRNPDEETGRGAVRNLYHIDLAAHPTLPRTWTLRFTGDGFLRHMVRNLVGTLVDVGSGRIRPEIVAEILAARDRREAGPTAPANGLVLEKVWYDPLAPK